MVFSVVSITFDSSQLGIQLKQNIQNFRRFIQRYDQFWFFRKGTDNSFLKKNVSDAIPYYWPKFMAWLPSLPERLVNKGIAIVC